MLHHLFPLLYFLQCTLRFLSDSRMCLIRNALMPGIHCDVQKCPSMGSYVWPVFVMSESHLFSLFSRLLPDHGPTLTYCIYTRNYSPLEGGESSSPVFYYVFKGNSCNYLTCGLIFVTFLSLQSITVYKHFFLISFLSDTF